LSNTLASSLTSIAKFQQVFTFSPKPYMDETHKHTAKLQAKTVMQEGADRYLMIHCFLWSKNVTRRQPGAK